MLESRGHRWASVQFLDLFAGSGAMGLEAASRGAKAVTLVENDRKVLSVLRANVSALALPGVVVRQADVHVLVTGPSAFEYDVVFVDPPYALASADLDSVLVSLALHGWLAPGATVMVERDRRSVAPVWPTGLAGEPSRLYGDTVVHLARWDGTDLIGSAD